MLTIFLITICIILYHIFTNRKKSLPSNPSHAATYTIGSSAQSIAGIDSYGNLSKLSFPTGMIMIWYPQDDALTSLNLLRMDIPAGWAICDGSKGTPDLRGRFVLMAQDSIPAGAPAGSTVHSIMSKGGEETHVLTETEMPSHSHSGGGQSSGGVICCGSDGGVRTYPGESSPKGGNAPHNNMPPYYTLVYIMKL
jgi:microcystin-dependent protein